MTMTGWKVRFAPHHGFPVLTDPYFAASAASGDVVDQIRYMADLGFAGMADNNLAKRPVAEQERIGRELAIHGMAMGSVACAPRAGPLFNLEPRGVEARLLEVLETHLAAAQRTGGRTLTIVATDEPSLSRAQQLGHMVENLKRVAPLAERAGVRLCIEAVSPQRMAGVLLTRTVDAEAIRREVDSPAVALMFDVVHVALEGDDVIDILSEVAPHVAAIQLADLPGRFEPGSGTLDFPAIIRAGIAAGFQGLYELEHLQSASGEAAEARMVSLLREIDAAI
jgi:hydroxypyruvate isomerase